LPKGDRDILKADPEDGTTPIANLLLEALALSKLTGKEKGAILYLWRVTYGWNVNGARLKECEIPLSTWSIVLQTDEAKASKILSGLVLKKIILRSYLGPGKSYSYSMNTRVAIWDKGCLNRQGLFLLLDQKQPKMRHFKAKRVVENDKGCPLGEGLSKTPRQPLSKTTIVSDTNLASPKEKERNIKKDIYIPDFIDKELWHDFLEMRRKIRKPPTDRAKELLLKDLEKLRTVGDDPNEVLKRSIKYSWQGVFPLKSKGNLPKSKYGDGW